MECGNLTDSKLKPAGSSRSISTRRSTRRRYWSRFALQKRDRFLFFGSSSYDSHGPGEADHGRNME